MKMVLFVLVATYRKSDQKNFLILSCIKSLNQKLMANSINLNLLLKLNLSYPTSLRIRNNLKNLLSRQLYQLEWISKQLSQWKVKILK